MLTICTSLHPNYMKRGVALAAWNYYNQKYYLRHYAISFLCGLRIERRSRWLVTGRQVRECGQKPAYARRSDSPEADRSRRQGGKDAWWLDENHTHQCLDQQERSQLTQDAIELRGGGGSIIQGFFHCGSRKHRRVKQNTDRDGTRFIIHMEPK